MQRRAFKAPIERDHSERSVKDLDVHKKKMFGSLELTYSTPMSVSITHVSVIDSKNGAMSLTGERGALSCKTKSSILRICNTHVCYGNNHGSTYVIRVFLVSRHVEGLYCRNWNLSKASRMRRKQLVNGSNAPYD